MSPAATSRKLECRHGRQVVSFKSNNDNSQDNTGRVGGDESCAMKSEGDKKEVVESVMSHGLSRGRRVVCDAKRGQQEGSWRKRDVARAMCKVLDEKRDPGGRPRRQVEIHQKQPKQPNPNTHAPTHSTPHTTTTRPPRDQRTSLGPTTRAQAHPDVPMELPKSTTVMLDPESSREVPCVLNWPVPNAP